LQEKGKITLTKYTLSFGIGKYLPGTWCLFIFQILKNITQN
jgi:hypothetical protein